MIFLSSINKYIYVVILTIAVAFIPTSVVSQYYSANKQETFFAEYGLGGGGAFSLGDVNGILFKDMRPYISTFFKYKFNGYLELKAQAEGGLVGVSSDPDMKPYSKSVGFNVAGEFNFFNFGVKRYQEYYSWASPYISLGIGAIWFDGQFAMTMPMGIGGKFKLSNRVNVGLQWTVSRVFHDNFDGVDDPIGLNEGFWNNRDWYSSVQVYMSFNFIKICAPCRNGVKGI